MIDETKLIRLLTEETKDIEITSGFNMFLIFVKNNKRPATYQYYKVLLTRLNNYLTNKNIFWFKQITNPVIQSLINFNKSRNLKNSTINKQLTAIKTIINFLVDSEIISRPSVKINKLKEEIPKIQIVQKEVLNKIFSYLKTIDNISMHCAFMLLISTGIRRTELMNIKVSNIDLNNNQIYLEHTKSGKPRYIYILNNEIKNLIIKTMNMYPNQTHLFYSRVKNKRATTSTLDSFFYKLKKELKLDNLSPHKLRHTYATILMENGADFNSVRILLGHTTTIMTQRYIQVTNERLHKINNTFNPIK